MKNDPGSELSFFVALAHHASLAGAARACGITPPAATRRLNQLETRLGVRLVQRTTRSLSLTAEGERYLEHAQAILAQVRALEDELASGQPRGRLRVNATLGFGRTTIAPLVSQFARRYPEIQLELQLTDRPLNLVEEAFDIGIRFGELPDSRLSARRVMANRRFLVAAPSYLRQHGEPAAPAELAQHRCILHTQNDEAHGIWRLSRGNKTETVKVEGALASNDGDVALGWALDGHGILLRSEWDAAKYLASGRLVTVLKAWRPAAADLFLYYPARQNLPARTRSFIDFLAAHFGAN